jgi:hypothetical protein
MKALIARISKLLPPRDRMDHCGETVEPGKLAGRYVAPLVAIPLSPSWSVPSSASSQWKPVPGRSSRCSRKLLFYTLAVAGVFVSRM